MCVWGGGHLGCVGEGGIRNGRGMNNIPPLLCFGMTVVAVVTIMKPPDCVCDNEDDTVVTTWATMYCCTSTCVYNTTGLNIEGVDLD